MTHNVAYLFSIYLIPPNLGNHQAEVRISPLALNQSKLLKYCWLNDARLLLASAAGPISVKFNKTRYDAISSG